MVVFLILTMICSPEVNPMAHEIKHVNLSDLREVPAWEQLLDKVRTTEQPAVLRADGEDVQSSVQHQRTGATRARDGRRRGFGPGMPSISSSA